MYTINGVNYNAYPNQIYTTNIPNNAIVLNNINNPYSINKNPSNIIYNLNQPQILNNNYNHQYQFSTNNIINNNTTSYYNPNNYLVNNQNQYLSNPNNITTTNITNNNINNINNVLTNGTNITTNISNNNTNNANNKNNILTNGTSTTTNIVNNNINTNATNISNNNMNNTNHVVPTNNINSLIPYNNGQVNNQNSQNNQKSTIQSNDFWQKIDNRKLSNTQHLNNNQQNNSVPQNVNNTNNNNNSDPMNQVLDDFFGNFFNDETPNHQITTHQVQINMGPSPQDMEPHVYFQSFFSPFGIHHGVFQQNYASNFGRQLARLIELSQRQRGASAHPPATNEALRKLKRFNLEERFCKNVNGKRELPNCCICQCEIEIGKQTVLLPCGHMYHWDCCLHWLKTNNTCPICRFEIK